MELPNKALLNKDKNADLQEWHERFGHQNKRYVKDFLSSNGLNVDDKNDFCVGCSLGKHNRMSFGQRIEHSTKPGELIFADVCGPIEEDDLYGHRYILVFKDDFTSYRHVYLIKRKDEVKNIIPKFVEMIKVQAGLVMKELRTDNGSEFNNKEVKDYAQSIGLKFSTSCPYTPQQNGVAEREK